MAYQKQIWENLPSVNTPLSADRLNHMEDGIYEAYEHGGGGETLPVGSEIDYDGETVPTGWEQVDEEPVYSTTETVCGTWVDGKPLYRKVFKFGAMPNTANKDIPHNISNLGTTIKCYGMAVRTSDSRALVIPDSVPSGEITCGVTNTNVYVTTYSDRSSFNDSHIIIEYTKTTD